MTSSWIKIQDLQFPHRILITGNQLMSSKRSFCICSLVFDVKLFNSRFFLMCKRWWRDLSRPQWLRQVHSVLWWSRVQKELPAGTLLQPENQGVRLATERAVHITDLLVDRCCKGLTECYLGFNKITWRIMPHWFVLATYFVPTVLT